MNTATAAKATEALIAEYNERIASRFQNCNLGSSRFVSRQRKIDAVVDEIGRRADEGDEIALNWFEEA